jgi:hypothetical protein
MTYESEEDYIQVINGMLIGGTNMITANDD